MFDTLLKLFTKALNVVRQQSQEVGVTGFDENEGMMMRPHSHPSLRTINKNWSLLFSAAGRAEPGGVGSSLGCKKGHNICATSGEEEKNNEVSALNRTSRSCPRHEKRKYYVWERIRSVFDSKERGKDFGAQARQYEIPLVLQLARRVQKCRERIFRTREGAVDSYFAASSIFWGCDS